MCKSTTGIAICILMAVSGSHLAAAKDTDDEISENFKDFKGTFETLPAGFSVSKDGISNMEDMDIDYRGIASGRIQTGGCYAWNISTNDVCLGCQPTEDKFTPGWVSYTFTNSTGKPLQRFTVAYDICYRNNADRSSTISLEVADETLDFVRKQSFTTEKDADDQEGWRKHRAYCAIKTKEAIQNGERIYVRWFLDDAGGSGSRDELGLDNIRIRLHKPQGTSFAIK